MKTSVVAVLLMSICACLAEDQSVDPSIRIGERDGVRHVIIIEREAEAGAMSVPQGLSDERLRKGIAEALWSPEKKAVVLAFQSHPQTFVLSFVRTAEGVFAGADISAVELGNLGKLGLPRERPKRIKTRPLKWMKRSDQLFQVLIETRVWKPSGEQVAASESLIIRSDGRPLFR